jgi:4-carboxymuconolactone decarboxylase
MTMANELHDKGMAVRRDVLGSEYVDRQIAAADDFNKPLQEMVTEYCWGWLWTRPQIPRKTRSLLNLAILSALNRPNEFKTHVKGALKNGCSKDEIREVLLQVAVYCGVPAGVEAFRLAREAFGEGEKRG